MNNLPLPPRNSPAGIAVTAALITARDAASLVRTVAELGVRTAAGVLSWPFTPMFPKGPR